MVFMEIINLDDSLDNISETKGNSPPSSSPLTSMDDSLKDSRKRKRRLSRNIRKVKKLLLDRKGNTENVETTFQSTDPDATLNSEGSPFLKNNSDDQITCPISKKKKRRKKPSVVVIDSEDECVIINKNQFKENNNLDSDILCLSDSSIIELSDSEDVGVVAGMVETAKEGSEWGVNRRKCVNVKQTPCCSSYTCTGTSHNASTKSGQNDSVVIRELRKRFRTDDQRVNRGKRHGIGEQTVAANSRTETKQNEVPKTTRQDSRHSISYLPLESTTLVREGPRPIIIDGSNVAFGHGKERFSAKGIEICVDYFLRRKHTEIRAFVPQFRRRHIATVGVHILEKLEKDGHLVYTPSRQVDGKRITSYDDRFIVEYAAKTGGIIVTRDNYQDLLAENKAWSDTINFRLLQYTFVGDMIMFPQDPLGRGGPTLDKFLMF